MPLTRFFLFLLLLCHCGSLPALAQAQVDANLSSTQSAVGDAIALTITIQGRQGADQRPVFEVDGLAIDFSGTQVQTIINNGVISGYYVYRYSVVADRKGEFTIPSVNVTVAGQNYPTPELKLTVGDAPETPKELEPILQLSVGKSEIWEGEVIPLTLSVLINTDMDITNLEHPSISRDDFVIKRWPNGPDQELERIGNITYRKIIYRTSVFPLKSGELTLGPAEVKAEAFVPTSGRRDPFGGGGTQRKFTLKSNEVKITVKPLPEANRPENFTGAVGKFSLTMEADPLDVEVDFPIMAKIQIDGTGNFDSITAPALESEQGWRVTPAKEVVEYRGNGLEPGAALYIQAIRPQDERKEIPSFVLSYFNPETATYETAHTAPVKIRVRPNAQLAAAKANPSTAVTGANMVDFGVMERRTPEEKMKSVLTIRTANPQWQALASSAPGGMPWWTWHAIGAALLALLLGIGLVQRISAAAKARRALAGQPPPCTDLLRQLRAERENSSRFYKLASDYLHSWQFHNGSPLPQDGPGAETVHRIFYGNGLANYSGSTPPPLPSAEHKQIVTALANF